jgi:hypothetical protein
MSDPSWWHVPTKPPSSKGSLVDTSQSPVSRSGVSPFPLCLNEDGDGDVITTSTSTSTTIMCGFVRTRRVPPSIIKRTPACCLSAVPIAPPPPPRACIYMSGKKTMECEFFEATGGAAAR